MNPSSTANTTTPEAALVQALTTEASAAAGATSPSASSYSSSLPDLVELPQPDGAEVSRKVHFASSVPLYPWEGKSELPEHNTPDPDTDAPHSAPPSHVDLTLDPESPVGSAFPQLLDGLDEEGTSATEAGPDSSFRASSVRSTRRDLIRDGAEDCLDHFAGLYQDLLLRGLDRKARAWTQGGEYKEVANTLKRKSELESRVKSLYEDLEAEEDCFQILSRAHKRARRSPFGRK
ncbi:hypothetical protein B0O80DRAFT_462742 [Mortierella sp. GBAus27b]|nr:hypothetical protein B0O80DRAFT_475946 [Mortierella sp. GBAus27b]KAI8345051.1 hypothetical protein B0O80DRAFT_475911 [Mortierella sp. GBAus27b]KAI8345552.1 hypothetical protein B0O80DRAFT_473011 [Mortierella sp. GBAus27b]KAI8346002.1 hypothetical protein B0O80DRAFT_470309 [Mortierella sp. GBAus27b]KAI8348627.1 hypothetical protein B0O80DRAFT_462742 [Mortierella sp. GBAus27b]